MVKKSPLPDLVIPEVAVHEYVLARIKEYGDDKAMVSVVEECSRDRLDITIGLQ